MCDRTRDCEQIPKGFLTNDALFFYCKENELAHGLSEQQSFHGPNARVAAAEFFWRRQRRGASSKAALNFFEK
jgi:hypothetical protein